MTPPLRSGPQKNPSVGSVAFKVVLFFATNPDEALTFSDIGLKFGGYVKDPRNVHAALKPSFRDGWLSKTPRVGQYGKVTIIAGPTLLKAIGL